MILEEPLGPFQRRVMKHRCRGNYRQPVTGRMMTIYQSDSSLCHRRICMSAGVTCNHANLTQPQRVFLTNR
jgi:hypothetical protein